MCHYTLCVKLHTMCGTKIIFIQGSLQRSVWKKFLSLEKFYTNVVGGVGDYYQVCPPSPPPPPTFNKLFKKTNVFFYSWESISSNGDSFVAGQMGLVHVHPEFWLNPSSPLHYFCHIFSEKDNSDLPSPPLFFG